MYATAMSVAANLFSVPLAGKSVVSKKPRDNLSRAVCTGPGSADQTESSPIGPRVLAVRAAMGSRLTLVWYGFDDVICDSGVFVATFLAPIDCVPRPFEPTFCFLVFEPGFRFDADFLVESGAVLDDDDFWARLFAFEVGAG